MISPYVHHKQPNLLTKAVTAFGRTVTRTATRVKITFSRARFSGWPTMMPNSRYNYQAMVGNGAGNSIVMALLLWICRTFPEAPVQVFRHEQDGTANVLTSHLMIDLLSRPNEFYSGPLLWMATLLDYLRGDAYWLKVRSAAGRPVELWYVPSDLMQPRWPDDGSVFISHYEYTPNGVPIPYDVQDVVHFRNGMDPANPRKGLGILGSLYREIFTDDEAANFTASLLRNLGVPGVILSPSENDSNIDRDSAEQIKGTYKERFNGDNRGEPLVLASKMTATVLSFTPQQMNLEAMRRIPEERVSAILGVSPMVVGLGAGLNASTYSNMREAKEAAWENCLVPTMRLLAAELRTQLLDDFEIDMAMSVRFDLSKVRALQGDLSELYRQATIGMAAGLLTRAKALSHVNLPSSAQDNVYVQSSLLVTVPIGGAAPPAPGSPLQRSPVQAPPPAAALVPSKGEHLDPAFKSIWDQLSPLEQQALLSELTPPAANGNGVKH